MKIFILIETFEKDYQYSDGFVNGCFYLKERAEIAAKMLRAFHADRGNKHYTCKVIERDVE